MPPFRSAAYPSGCPYPKSFSVLGVVLKEKEEVWGLGLRVEGLGFRVWGSAEAPSLGTNRDFAHRALAVFQFKSDGFPGVCIIRFLVSQSSVSQFLIQPSCGFRRCRFPRQPVPGFLSASESSISWFPIQPSCLPFWLSIQPF